MNTLILATLFAFFTPSSETCSAPDLVTYYETGRSVGFSSVAVQFGEPINCDAVAAKADALTAYANRAIALSRGKPPTSACAYFGVGEAMLEAVDLALVQCQGSRDQ